MEFSHEVPGAECGTMDTERPARKVRLARSPLGSLPQAQVELEPANWAKLAGRAVILTLSSATCPSFSQPGLALGS